MNTRTLKTKVSLIGTFIWSIAAMFYLYEFFLRNVLGTVAGQVIKEALMDDLDVPTLMLEVDGIDPRIASIEQIRGKFETFFETYF